MRRPLKPFVTEYKTSSRRQQQGFTEAPAQPGERPAAMPTRADIDNESSYEAALRAADALFSGRPKTEQVLPATSAEAPAAGSPAAGSPAAEAFFGSASEATAPKSAGRILRVLDEPPSPQLAALEAAYAPKRRGRKPGSKNKPKVPPAEVVALAPPLAPAAPIEAIAVEEPRAPAPKRNGRLVPVRTGKRLSWVRDKLGPGEGWKRRRLPRVCW